MIYKTLYHLDNNENVRTWFVERDGSQYRVHSGIEGGKIVTSGWKQTFGKNVGKSNETTDEDQAHSEILSMYQKKIDRKYSENKDTAARSNFVAPMLAETLKAEKLPKLEGTWYAQPKFDGIRCLTDDKGGTSRSGKPFVTVTHIVDALDEMVKEFNVTFDGELYNHDYRDKFEDLVSLIKKTKLASLSNEKLEEIRNTVEFHVYDVIMWDNPEATYEERQAFLAGLFEQRLPKDSMVKHCPSVKLVNPTLAEINKLHDEYFSLGYEGLMLRKGNSVYEFKRSKGLWKYKNFDEGEFEIVDIVEGVGNWAGAAKSVFVRLADETTSKAGVKGTMERNKFVLENKEKFIGSEVTIIYQGFTEDKKLRFGRVKAFHDGKRDD